MKLKFTTLIGFMAASLVATGGAQAQLFEKERPPAGAKPLSEIVKVVEDKGYTITEIEFEDGVWEVDAYEAEGKEIELEIDPMSGKIEED